MQTTKKVKSFWRALKQLKRRMHNKQVKQAQTKKKVQKIAVDSRRIADTAAKSVEMFTR